MFPPNDLGQVQRLVNDLESAIQTGRLSGVVVLAGFGETPSVFQGMGTLQPGGAVMPREAIFRITSLTKPITAACLLQLVESKRIALNDPIAYYLPEFAREKGEPAQEIMVLDLLRHTAGFPDLQDQDVDALFNNSPTIAEFSRGLAHLNLADVPGKQFRYGPAFEIVGHLIEVVAGEPLDSYFERCLLSPLGMVDTHFIVPEGKRSRIPAIVRLDGDNFVVATPAGMEPAAGTHFLSGGGGLRSTASDLFRFGRMLANDGVLDGVQVLQPSTVELLTGDQLGDLSPWRDRGMSWGLGIQVAGLEEHPARAFGWGGFFGGTWWASRVSGLVVVVLTHQIPSGRPDLEGAVRALAVA